MALLRTKEIRAMRPDDLNAKMKELSDELMHERGVAAMGGAPASPGKLRALRTNVARILTIKRELELAEKAKKAEEAKAPGKGKKTEGKAAAEAAAPKRKKAKQKKQEEPGEGKEEKK